MGCVVRCCRAILRNLTGTYTPTPRPPIPNPPATRTPRTYKKRGSNNKAKGGSDEGGREPILAIDSLDSTLTSPPPSLECMG
ncbi:hypothetical protein EON65_48085, partial [archaeon]